MFGTLLNLLNFKYYTIELKDLLHIVRKILKTVTEETKHPLVSVIMPFYRGGNEWRVAGGEISKKSIGRY